MPLVLRMGAMLFKSIEHVVYFGFQVRPCHMHVDQGRTHIRMSGSFLDDVEGFTCFCKTGAEPMSEGVERQFRVEPSFLPRFPKCLGSSFAEAPRTPSVRRAVRGTEYEISLISRLHSADYLLRFSV